MAGSVEPQILKARWNMRYPGLRYAGVLVAVAAAFTSISAQPGELESVATLAGEPRATSAAGVTRSGARLMTIENPGPFESGSAKRLVIVADDERAARAALSAIKWFKTSAPRALRDQWAISALLLTYANDAAPAQRLLFPPEKGFFDHPEQPESRYAWRWTAYQAPDLVLQIRGGDSLTRGD